MKRIFLAFALSTTFLLPSALSQKLLTAINIGAQALTPVANVTNNMIYVPNYGLNTLTVISGASETVVDNITMPYQPLAAAVNTTTNMVYVATASENSDNGAIVVVDASSNNVVAIVPAFPVGSIAVNPATDLIYFVNGGGIISVLDGTTNQVVGSINTALGCCIQGIDVDTVTNRIYATENVLEGRPELVAIDGATNNFQIFPLTGTYGVTAPIVDSTLNRVYVPVNSISGLLVINGATGKILETALPQCNNPATINLATNLVAIFQYTVAGPTLDFFSAKNLSQVGGEVVLENAPSPGGIAAGANNRYYMNFWDGRKTYTSVAVFSGP